MLVLIVALLVTSPAFAQPPISNPVYPAGLDSAMLARLVDGYLANARTAIERLAVVRGRRTAANTLRPFDDANNALENAQGLLAIATQVHPDSAVRAEGRRAEERLSRVRSDLAADPRVARAFATLDTAALSAEERLLVARVRREYHRAGADRDEPTRQRFRTLFESRDRLTSRFALGIAGDTTKVLATAEELAGMPPEWIAAHARLPSAIPGRST